MSEPDSPLSSPPASPSATPSDAILEQGLRDAITSICDSERFDELTVNGIRIAAQAKLGLREGFFKEGEWKGRSKRLIEDEVVSSVTGDTFLECTEAN